MSDLPSLDRLPFQFRGGLIHTGPIPLVMGILNATPDSFSDGGLHQDPGRLAQTAQSMIDEGAAILDIGGESSRPGATPVSLDEELKRVLPAIEAIRRFSKIAISIDTVKPKVALESLAAGANIINDISGLINPAMREVALNTGAGVMIMHMKGDPKTMQKAPGYRDVTQEVHQFLKNQVDLLVREGIPKENLMIDPGIGFGKTQEHNLKLIKDLNQFESLKRPILVGVSRKSLVGFLTGRKLEERLAGTLALQAFTMGRVSNLVFRVHDVGPTIDLCKVWSALSE